MKTPCLLILVLGGCYASVNNNRVDLPDQRELQPYQPRIFEDTVRKELEKVREILKNGDPSKGIPSFNPLEINELTAELSVLRLDFLNGTINIQNLLLCGIPDWELNSLKISPVINFPPGAKVNAEFTWPIVNLSTAYKLDISVFGWGIEHEGTIKGLLNELHNKLFVQAVLQKSVQIKEFDLTPSLESASLKIDDLDVFEVIVSGVTHILELIRIILKTGIPDLGIPSLDPLEIPTISMDLTLLNLEFLEGTITIENMVVNGIAHWVQDNLSIIPNFEQFGVEITHDITWPILNLSTAYNLDISVFGLSIEHEGTLEGLLNKLRMKLFVQASLGIPIAINDFALTSSLESASLKINDLDVFEVIVSGLTHILELIRIILKTGIPDLGIPSLDPLEIPTISMDLTLLNLKFLEGTFTIENMVANGIAHWVQDDLSIIPNQEQFGVEITHDITWPTLSLSTLYNLDISVFGLGIEHVGTIEGLLNKLHLKLFVQAAISIPITINDFALTPSLESGSLKINDLDISEFLKAFIDLIINNINTIVETVTKVIETITNIVTTIQEIGKLITSLEGSKSFTLNLPIGSIEGSAELNGLSKLGITAFEPAILPSGISTTVRFGLAGNNVARIILNYELKINDPDLSWMVGKGIIDVIVRDTNIAVEIVLQDTFSLEDLLFKISEETKFARFEHAGAELSDTSNSILHNLDIQDIISVLLLDLIKYILTQKPLATEIGPMISSNLNKLDKDIIKGFITFVQRARDY